jgi:hypothetical protein
METQSVAPAVFGHQDFTSTDCPGDVIYGMRNTALKTRPGGVVLPPPVQEDPVATALPLLRPGVESFDVLTLRALLFERFLSERFDPSRTVATETEADFQNFFNWLRSKKYDDDLRKDVVEYQKWRFPGEPDEWDGIVGPKTWAQLWRTT